LIFSNLDYRALKNSYILIALYGFLILLLCLIFVIGHVSKGGARWFNLGSFFIGPSEPMKLVLILVLAKFFSKRHIAIANIKNIILSLVYLAVPAVLVMLQPDLSTAIILCVIWFGMLLVSGLSRRHIILFFGIALTLGLILWNFYFQPFQKSRIINFVDPTRDLQGTGWNAYQSIIAAGSGGVLGKGVGFGTQSRLGFLPEHETDFIFASFLEEWGMIGGIIVFILFTIIIFNLAKKSTRGNTNFETLFTLGVCIWLTAQTLFNIGMNIGVFPVTGIPLPFMSHGGSHILIESIALGMCVGMSKYGTAAHKSRFKREFLGLE
jgi:rod shape determining protein RodA